MRNWISFNTTAFFILTSAVQYGSCDSFTISPATLTCLTLQQYATNPSQSSSITIELQAGNHPLDFRLLASNINSFEMRATTEATVTCNQQLQSLDYNWLQFSQVRRVYASDIVFVGCRINMNDVTNATFVRSSFVNKTNCCYYGVASSPGHSQFFNVTR